MPTFSLFSGDVDRSEYDVVFLHGLGGKGQQTWVSKRADAPWPTWLVDDDPRLAVWFVDYDASPLAWGPSMRLRDRSTSLLSALKTRVGGRPFVLVGHSMGGLLIKMMVEHCHSRRDDLRHVMDKLAGVVFMATPHLGSQIADLGRKVAPGLSSALVGDLKSNLPELLDVGARYRDYVTESRLPHLIFAERRTTKGVLIVDPASSDPGVPFFTPVPVDTNHVDICKIAEKDNDVYLRILAFIQECFEPYPTSVVQLIDQNENPKPAHYSQVSHGFSVTRRIPPNTTPPMPAHFAPREELSAQLRDDLLEPSSTEAARVVGLVGMGGSGKSVLARALARDEQICRVFADGIVWLELGPRPNLLARQAQVVEAFGDSRPAIDSQQALARLNMLLTGASCLIVLDNVWERRHLRAFELLEPNSALLVTTRNQDIFDRSVITRTIDPLPKKQAQGLLAAWAEQDQATLPAEADEVAKECGRLPLALAVAGGMVADGHTWQYVCERLRRADLDRLEINLPDYRYRNLLRVLDASVSDLAKKWRNRFLELAIFDGRGDVPTEVVETIWRQAGLDDLDIQDLIIRLARRSLLQHDAVAGTLTLHDLQFDYARHKLGDQRLQEQHANLAATILNGWGGMNHDLPLLWTSPLKDAVERYGALHMIAHLKGANRDRDIHCLLAMNSPPTTAPGHPARIENMWYAVHDRIGEIAPYSGDVSLAWSLARTSANEVFVKDAPAGDIGLEVRYALVTASIASIAANVPPQLLVALVASGHWTAKHGLAYARRIPTPETRIRALANLLSFLQYMTPADVQSSASDDIGTVNASATRTDVPSFGRQTAEALEAAAEVLAAAGAIGNPRSRANILTAVAGQLPEPARGAAVDQAWEAVRSISSGYSRAEALAAFVTKIKLPEALQSQVLAAAGAIDNPRSRASILTTVAAQLSEPVRTAVLDDARAAIAVIGEPEARAGALMALIPHLPEPDRATAKDDAQTAIRSINERVARVDAFTNLAFELSESDRAPALAQALTEARAINDARLQATTFSALVPQVPEWWERSKGKPETERVLNPNGQGILHEALTNARASGDPNSRATALLVLAPLLPKERDSAFAPKASRSAVIEEALTEAYRVRDAADRAAVLTALASEIPEPGYSTVIDEACAAACLIEDPDMRANTLVTLASKIPEALGRQALIAAGAIDTVHMRSMTFAAALASCVPNEEDHLMMAHALLEAAQASDELGPTATLPDSEAFYSLPERDREALFLAANAVTHAIDEAYQCASAVAVMTSGNTKRLAKEEWVSTTADPIATLCSKANDLNSLAVQFPDALQDQSLRAISEIENVSSWFEGDVIRPQFPRLGQFTMLDEVLNAESAFESAFAFLGTQLSGPILTMALEEAREIALAIRDPARRATALIALIPKLPKVKHATVLGQALTASLSIDDASRRSYVLEAVAKHSLTGRIPPWEPYWRAVIEDSATRGRAVLISDLSALKEIISCIGGSLAVQKTIYGLLDVARWWP